MLRRQGTRRGLIGIAMLLLPLAAVVPVVQATSSASPAKANGICRTNYDAAKKWSHGIPMIETDEDMATWETGIAQHFGWTAQDLRSAGASALSIQFGKVAAGHRVAAVAYLSGSYTRTQKAEASLRTISARAIRVSGGQGATVCVAFIKDFRP